MQSGPSSFGTVATAYGSKATDSYYQLTGQATNIVADDITVKGNLTVDGTTDLSGAVTMRSDLDVSGNVLIGGDTELNGNLVVNGASGIYASVGPISTEDILVVYNRTQGLPPQLDGPAAKVSGNVLIDSSGSLSVPTGSVDALTMNVTQTLTAADVSSGSVSLTSLKALNRVGTPGAPVDGGGGGATSGQLGYAGALSLYTAGGGDPFLGNFYLPAGCSADSMVILSLITFLQDPPGGIFPTSWSPPSVIIIAGGPTGFQAVIAMDQESADGILAVFKYFVVV